MSKTIRELVDQIVSNSSPTISIDAVELAKTHTRHHSALSKLGAHVKDIGNFADGNIVELSGSYAELENATKHLANLKELRDSASENTKGIYDTQIRQADRDLQRTFSRAQRDFGKIDKLNKEALKHVARDQKEAVNELDKLYRAEVAELNKEISAAKRVGAAGTVTWKKTQTGLDSVSIEKAQEYLREMGEKHISATQELNAHFDNIRYQHEAVVTEMEGLSKEVMEASEGKLNLMESLTKKGTKEVTETAKEVAEGAKEVKFGAVRSILMGAALLLGAHGLMKAFSAESTGSEKATGFAEVAGAGVGGALVYNNYKKAIQGAATVAHAIH